ncbi:hypothetical protein CSKR_108475 [Clonorchis sinensis]|uniref:Uncharacterized protein n=1 Tax=Clonorchis sinensis TaxID=79923 RepID=A0A3R7EP09_CLOSI|nr:hypothetical protein CSKR_108475 [Clonorchis sinensis]
MAGKRSMKETMTSLGTICATRLPGWRPRDPHCVWLRTPEDKIVNRCQQRSCCQVYPDCLNECPEVTAFVDKPPFERFGFWGFARNSTWSNRLLETVYNAIKQMANSKPGVDLRSRLIVRSVGSIGCSVIPCPD